MMKNYKYKIALIAMMMISSSSLYLNAQLKINSSGNVGVGLGNDNPTYKLDVQGKVRFGNYGLSTSWEQIILDWDNQWGAPELYSNSANLALGKSTIPVNAIYVNWLTYKNIYGLSDERTKEEIKPLKSVSERLVLVNGKSYKFKENKEVKFKESKNQKTNFGFIAQELEKIFPDLVIAPDSTNPYYAIDYIGMIPLLVEAFKEQQNKIAELEKLREIVTNCCSGNGNIKPKSTKVAINDVSASQETAQLFQNTPNPFTAETEIQFYLPQNAASAKIIVHNMLGNEVKTYTLQKNEGAGKLTLKGNELEAGLYLYSLVVDGNLVDTKKMLLTK